MANIGYWSTVGVRLGNDCFDLTDNFKMKVHYYIIALSSTSTESPDSNILIIKPQYEDSFTLPELRPIAQCSSSNSAPLQRTRTTFLKI